MFTPIDKGQGNKLWENKDLRIPDTIRDVTMSNADILAYMPHTQGRETVHIRENRQQLAHHKHRQTHTGNFPKQSLPTRPSFRSVTLHEVTLAAVEGALH